MLDQRTRITMAAVGIVAVAASGFGYLTARHSQPPAIVISGPPSDPPPPISAASGSSSASTPPSTVLTIPDDAPAVPKQIPQITNDIQAHAADSATLAVDVSGAVRNPTLYYLPPGSRIQQAIHAAGGPTSKADLDQINLAEKVTDGEKIYIPRRNSEWHSGTVVESGNSIGEVAPAPIMPLAPVPPLPVSTPAGIESTHGSSSHGHSSNKLTSPADGQIDLNTASAEDLQRIPGIGPAMSARIIAYREQSGPFHSVDDLRSVSGVGEKKLARWSPFLVVH